MIKQLKCYVDAEWYVKRHSWNLDKECFEELGVEPEEFYKEKTNDKEYIEALQIIKLLPNKGIQVLIMDNFDCIDQTGYTTVPFGKYKLIEEAISKSESLYNTPKSWIGKDYLESIDDENLKEYTIIFRDGFNKVINGWLHSDITNIRAKNIDSARDYAYNTFGSENVRGVYQLN